MTPQDQPATNVDNRRTDERRTVSGPLRVSIESPSFEGRSDNVSAAGVFFFSPERLRVKVEYEEEGTTRVRTGYLVRVQRMSEATTGYAIEFDLP